MNSSSMSRNIKYFQQSLKAVIGNTGYFVKILSTVVCIGYLLSYSESAVRALSVTPGYLLPPKFWLWTAFTHCFIEIRLWQVVVDIVTLVLCGKLVEPLWGSFEMVFFFLLVNICVAFISALFYLILYMIIANPEVLFNVQIQGMAGYIAGLSVAVKQIMPDHVILHTHTPLGKITNRHVPLLLFIVSCVLYICHLLEGLYATMIGCGIGVSWIYLRFYQVHSNGSRGDLADAFKFSSFFPTVLQPPVQVFADSLFYCLVKLKVCRRAVRKYDVGAPTSISISLPGVDPSDAERRRQKALKLLSQRLNQQGVDSVVSWPTEDPIASEESADEKVALLSHAPTHTPSKTTDSDNSPDHPEGAGETRQSQEHQTSHSIVESPQKVETEVLVEIPDVNSSKMDL